MSWRDFPLNSQGARCRACGQGHRLISHGRLSLEIRTFQEQGKSWALRRLRSNGRTHATSRKHFGVARKRQAPSGLRVLRLGKLRLGEAKGHAQGPDAGDWWG